MMWISGVGGGIILPVTDEVVREGFSEDVTFEMRPIEIHRQAHGLRKCFGAWPLCFLLREIFPNSGSICAHPHGGSHLDRD